VGDGAMLVVRSKDSTNIEMSLTADGLWTFTDKSNPGETLLILDTTATLLGKAYQLQCSHEFLGTSIILIFVLVDGICRSVWELVFEMINDDYELAGEPNVY
jgi:hypothetical protein